jgi:hypothetical protein
MADDRGRKRSSSGLSASVGSVQPRALPLSRCSAIALSSNRTFSFPESGCPTVVHRVAYAAYLIRPLPICMSPIA